MNRIVVGTLMVILLVAAAPLYCQVTTIYATPTIAAVALMNEPGDQDGPDQTIYKKGYDLVLDEKWDAARKQFADLLDKYPKSNYADDARYWSAYALMHTDLKKALTTYKEFVNKYPKSTYYDDAVADLANVQAQLDMATAQQNLDSLGHHGMVYVPQPVIAPDMRELDSKMRLLDKNMRRMRLHFPRGFAIPATPFMTDEKKLDARTRLKLDALQALGDNTEDPKAFATLKDIALDRKQPVVLRKEALNVLCDFEKQDIDAVCMDVVRNDTSTQMQVVAIENIGHSGKDKDKTVETLSQLYSSLPTTREEQRSAALYRIADIGNDRAVDFLTKVAKNDSDYDMRSDAVYYLGNIGGDKARAVLYEILKGE